MSKDSITQEEPRRVAYDLVYNDSKQVIAVNILIDDTWHEMGKKELWDLHRIVQTTFNQIFTQE